MRSLERSRGQAAPRRPVVRFSAFQHIPDDKLREAFGPVIDRLAANGIDLSKMPVEVAPIAHYHMGGAEDRHDRGQHGCPISMRRENSLRAPMALIGSPVTRSQRRWFLGGSLAKRPLCGPSTIARQSWNALATEQLETASASTPRPDLNLAGVIAELQAVMADFARPFRTREGLEHALAEFG